MSAMPQTAKLTIKTPITVAMTILPSQFDEAFRIPRSMGPTCFTGEGNRVVPKGNSIRDRIPQQGVTELKIHHKVAAAPSQPRPCGLIEAVNGRGII
jgi:hypothetical protein